MFEVLESLHTRLFTCADLDCLGGDDDGDGDKQQMEKENINMFRVRKVSGASIRSVIEKISLQGIEHMVRIDNSRVTEQVRLG